jgi:hypothetical protein
VRLDFHVRVLPRPWRHRNAEKGRWICPARAKLEPNIHRDGKASARTYLLPFMLTDAPIPSGVLEEISVTFLPQFLGAFPWALSPLGALAYL